MSVNRLYQSKHFAAHFIKIYQEILHKFRNFRDILTNIAALSGISSGSTTLFVKVPVNQYLDLCSRFILL